MALVAAQPFSTWLHSSAVSAHGGCLVLAHEGQLPHLVAAQRHARFVGAWRDRVRRLAPDAPCSTLQADIVEALRANATLQQWCGWNADEDAVGPSTMAPSRMRAGRANCSGPVVGCRGMACSKSNTCVKLMRTVATNADAPTVAARQTAGAVATANMLHFLRTCACRGPEDACATQLCSN